jgi:DNA mismatch repair protein MutH
MPERLPPPPQSEGELVARATALAGRSLGDLAHELGATAPVDLRRHKGWVGQLLERALGATAASRDEPDFVALGIELKSLPVDRRGVPVETTFVCTVPLDEVAEVPWERSRPRRKLERVLWMPVEGERTIRVDARRLGTPLLWSPSEEQEALLRGDWEDLAGIIGRGDVESLTARRGRALQVRPKAANSRVRRRAIDDEGALIETLPRGFYLRTSFTAEVLKSYGFSPLTQ